MAQVEFPVKNPKSKKVTPPGAGSLLVAIFVMVAGGVNKNIPSEPLLSCAQKAIWPDAFSTVGVAVKLSLSHREMKVVPATGEASPVATTFVTGVASDPIKIACPNAPPLVVLTVVATCPLVLVKIE